MCSTIYMLSVTFWNMTEYSSPLLLRGVPNTARILCRSFTPVNQLSACEYTGSRDFAFVGALEIYLEFFMKRHRQLWAKNLPKVPTWRLEQESNPRPFRTIGIDSTNEPPRPLIKFNAFMVALIFRLNVLTLKNWHEPKAKNMSQAYWSERWFLQAYIMDLISPWAILLKKLFMMPLTVMITKLLKSVD